MPIHRLLEIVHLDQTRSGSYSCGLPDSFADVARSPFP